MRTTCGEVALTTRSAQLVLAELAVGGLQVLFTAAPGYRTLLKSAVLWQHGTATSLITFNVLSSRSVRVGLARFEAAPVGPHTWEGWVMLEPGDQVEAYTESEPCSVVVSGAELLEP